MAASNFNKRKREESPEIEFIPLPIEEITPLPVKKRKLSKKQKKEQQSIEYVYVVLKAGHELGPGSDYFQDSLLKETFDTEICGVFKSRNDANAHAEGLNEDYSLKENVGNDPTLKFYEGTWENTDYGNATHRIWVEKQRLR